MPYILYVYVYVGGHTYLIFHMSAMIFYAFPAPQSTEPATSIHIHIHSPLTRRCVLY